MKEILFICTGNTCRSPMAEGLMNAGLHARNKDREFCARSAGLFAEGGSANPNAAAVMKERGIDLSNHRSRQLTGEMIENAFRVYTMSESAAEQLKAALPGFAEKIRPLPGAPIPDPYGGGMEVYRLCADRLEQSVEHLLKEAEQWN